MGGTPSLRDSIATIKFCHENQQSETNSKWGRQSVYRLQLEIGNQKTIRVTTYVHLTISLHE